MSHRDLRQAVVALPAISDPQAIAGGATAVYARSCAPNEALADEIDRLIAECDNAKDMGMSTSKKRMAGKSSGITRAKFAKLRQQSVLSAFERLKPKYQLQPFSEEALDALEEEFRRERQDEDGVAKPGKSVLPPEQSDRLFKEAIYILLEGKHGTRLVSSASRETLIKDLKALGIRSKLRKQRSG